MHQTRSSFREQLATLENQALDGLDLVADQLDRVMEAVQHQDIELAAMVIQDDDVIDGRYLEVHQGVLSLLARQAPVATDLRLVAAVLDVIKHVERMGDQCVNIAKLLPLEGHEPPSHPGLLEKIAEMGAAAALRGQPIEAGVRAPRRRASPRTSSARTSALNALNRECFRIAMEIGDDCEVREWAMHMMLVARAIERIGDNAVDIGEQTAFVVTGLFREFTDASHGKVAPPAIG